MTGSELLRRVTGLAGRWLPVDRVTGLLTELEHAATTRVTPEPGSSPGPSPEPAPEPEAGPDTGPEPEAGTEAAEPAPVGSARAELLTLATYLIGAGLATAGAVTRAARLPAAVPALAGVASNVPQLREAARARLGGARADRLFATGESVLGALAGHPAGLLVNAVHGGQRVREARAAEQALRRRAAHQPASVPGSAPAGAAGRPVPLPPGPVERYAAQAASAGLAGALGGVLAARPGLRLASLSAASGKAARLTKESWASRVARSAADHDVVTSDPRVFRRLDRVDTVVIDAALLTTGRLGVEEVVPLPEVAEGGPADLYATALQLLTPDAPDPPGWGLTRAPHRGEPPYRELSRRLVPGGRLCTLHHHGRAVAAVAAAPELDPHAEAVVAAAQQVGRVLVAGTGSHLDRRLAVSGTVPAGSRLPEELRSLQAGGHGVALLARSHAPRGPGPAQGPLRRNRRALAAADCGVAVVAGDGPVDATAGHLVCGPGLAEATRLLAAVPAARRAARAGVLTAGYGAAAGALIGLSGLGGQHRAGRSALLAADVAALAGIAVGAWYADPVARRRPPGPVDRNPWHAVPVPEVLRRLGSSLSGLSTSEADRRHHEAGDDIPPEGMGRATAHELDNPLTPALAAGAGLAAASGSTLDSVLIGVVLAVNALVGGGQRWGAGRAVRRLAGRTAVPQRLWRDDHPVNAPAQDLVRGDVIELRAGDAVPADARLLTADGLELDEAGLTGESMPVAKSPEPTVAREPAQRRSMVYEGTAVAAGRARAAVVATGESTESRRAEALAEPPDPGGVPARLAELTSGSLKLSLAGGGALLAANLLRGRPLRDSITAAVSLTVAAVPEGLPSVATVAQLSAANRLSRRGVLVRNPAALESLGRLRTLCFDKTGTLTEGSLRLRLVADRTGRARSPELPERLRAVLAAALRASPPPRRSGRRLPHPTDQAVVSGGQENRVDPDYGRPGWTPVDELPFEPARGFHAVHGRVGDEYLLSVKGAPEVVLSMCAERLPAAERERLGDTATELARGGYRVLAIAEGPGGGARPLEGGMDRRRLEFVGFLALADRARPTAARAVATLGRAGVRVVMVTGDHPSTAEAVAAELGLLDSGRVLTGSEIDERSDAELAGILPSVTIFARVDPGHKVRVVRLLRAAGETVAVTGDGANDAPAIRSADVGMALGSYATAAARQAADVVVTDDRIETVVDAIVEGRLLWSSVREAVSMLLGGNLGEIGFTVAAGMAGAGSFTPRQLLLVNMLTDVVPAMALAARQPPGTSPEGLLAEGPTSSLGAALHRDIRVRATATAGAAGAAWLVARATGTSARASTVALIALVSAQLGQTLLAGGRDPVVVAACAVSLGVLVGTVQLPGLSQLVACRPVGPFGWALALAASAAATAWAGPHRPPPSG